MSDRPYYITASIFYPNGNPHMGHALEWAQSDFLARYHRLFGDKPVKFQIGLDEHGLKIYRTAEQAGVSAQTFVEEKLGVFQNLADKIQMSHDTFIRTSSPEHKAIAQAFWRACAANGDIYKKTYRAWYNIKQEEFLGLAEDVQDPSIFGVDEKFLELIEEENYFFKWSRYTEQVVALLKSGQYKVYPQSRAQEMINFAESKGLQDISISREASKLPWGIPVPDDDTQVMYVWFDALTNYLTGISTLSQHEQIIPNEFWPAELHTVGKDISRFHGLLWPAMLLSAGIALPRQLLVHGFVLSEGKAMSKSIGNVVDPIEMIEEFGSDPVRWYLLTEIPTTGDGDFTKTRIAEVYASDLANDYGNLVSRVLTMSHKYVDGKVPMVAPEHVDNLEKAIVEEKWHEYHKAVNDLQIHTALDAAKALIVFCNRRIEEHKPWELAKDEHKREELHELLYELLEIIRHITLMITPAMPSVAARVAAEVFPNLAAELWQGGVGSAWGILPTDMVLGSGPVILFPRKEMA